MRNKVCHLCLNKYPYEKSRRYCRDCSPSVLDTGHAAHKADIRRVFKKTLVDLFNGECLHCKLKSDQSLYDFHHTDSNEKDFAISQDGHTRSLEKILKEVNKCVMLCKNCHALLHANIIVVDYSKFDRTLINQRIKMLEEYNTESYSIKCSECNKDLYGPTKSGMCKECLINSNRSKRPSPLELAKLVTETNFAEVGRMYNIKGNSVRKWCKNYDIPHTTKELKEWYEENKE